MYLYFFTRKHRFALLTLVIAMAISGCRYDRDHDGVDDEDVLCINVKGPKNHQGCPIPPEARSIHLFLDNSASMAGYYDESTDYKAIVTDLAVKMDREIKPVDVTLIAQQEQPFHGSPVDLANAFATTRFSTQRGSELHKMLATVAKRAGKGEVALLITDGILSFPDSDIIRNREINVTDAKSTLKNNIYATFRDLRKAGYAVSLYAFKSKFFGTYYTYQNGHIPFKGEIRPFYLWVIGQQALLPAFDARLENISSFHPEQVMHFGLLDSAVQEYQVLPQVNKSGQWAKTDNGISDIAIGTGQPLQIALGVDLNKLPPYARETHYLQSHLQATCSGCDVKVSALMHNQADSSKLKSNRQLLAFSRSTHVLLLKIPAMAMNEANIHVVLPMRYDDWATRWSTMDDRDIITHSDQTFAFEHLVQGVLDAYDTRTKNFLEINLKLNKK